MTDIPTALTIKFHNRFGSGSGEAGQQQLLFANCKEAKKAFGALYKATKSYESRANDREKYISVTHLSGECFVDVSDVASVAYQDELRDGIREVIETWQRGCGAMHGSFEAAKEAAKNKELAA